MKYTLSYLQRISSLCVWNMIDMAAHALTATAWAEYDPFTFCFTFKTGVDNVLECRPCIRWTKFKNVDNALQELIVCVYNREVRMQNLKKNCSLQHTKNFLHRDKAFFLSS
jgi:hypothetical protein